MTRPTHQQLTTPSKTLKNEIQKTDFGTYQRWSRGHKARGQGQGHKKNPRPRPRTAFPRTEPLEPRTGMLEAKAKDQGHRRKPSPKKKVFKIFFRRSPIHRRTQNFDWGGLNHNSHEMTSSKFFQRSFCGTKIS